MADSPLFAVYAVHCFLPLCPHVVRATSPEQAHTAMEEHYRTAHGPLVAHLAGQVRVTV